MKIVVLNSDNRVLYMEEDSGNLEVKTNHVTYKGSRIFGLTSETATLYLNADNPEYLFATTEMVANVEVTTLDSFQHSKFLYDGANWSKNPDWVDPTVTVSLEANTAPEL